MERLLNAVITIFKYGLLKLKPQTRAFELYLYQQDLYIK